MSHHRSTRVSYSVFCFILLWLPLICVHAQETSLISVPAAFVRELTPPSTAEGFLRPEGVFVDNRFAEVFVSDPGHNRVVAFDTSGLYKFEFSCADIFGAPGDVVVDSRGFIFVLGSTGSGMGIYQFDYDGQFMHELHLTGLAESTLFRPTHLTIDESDKLYVIDGDQRLVCSFNTDGVLQSKFAVLTDIPEDQRKEALFGAPRIAGGLFYLPVSTFGSIFVYDLEGNFVRNIGDEGADIGKLNFPVAVAVSADSLVLVLDKHRYNVLCFTITGKFVGEFGGMGYRSGWFYHPNSLATDNFGRCYITQIFLNLVQVCELPKTIAEKAKLLTLENSQVDRNKPVLATKGEEVTSKLTALLLTDNYLSTINFTFWRFYHA